MQDFQKLANIMAGAYAADLDGTLYGVVVDEDTTYLHSAWDTSFALEPETIFDIDFSHFESYGIIRFFRCEDGEETHLIPLFTHSSRNEKKIMQEIVSSLGN